MCHRALSVQQKASRGINSAARGRGNFSLSGPSSEDQEAMTTKCRRALPAHRAAASRRPDAEGQAGGFINLLYIMVLPALGPGLRHGR